jgi:predicted short-subunit dehydrogenase-like oxidoreductase (DUF2520 family)
MRELDRDSSPDLPSCAVIGAGRLGTVLAQALSEHPPVRRGEPIPDVDVVLLCVPDDAIASVAASVPPGPLVGHCSGATTLDVFDGREGFSLHPLMSVPTGSTPDVLRGAGAAVDGTSERALEIAHRFAAALGMNAVHVNAEDRAAYHAAGAIASNFLVALETCAERLAASCGVTREQLAPLVLATAEQWARMGAQALTGPIARGDNGTVERHRAVIAERMPDLLPAWTELVEVTRAVAGRA